MENGVKNLKGARLFPKTFIKTLKEYTRGMVEATIEDLAFGIRFSRESDEVGRRVCLSYASYAAAENS